MINSRKACPIATFPRLIPPRLPVEKSRVKFIRRAHTTSTCTTGTTAHIVVRASTKPAWFVRVTSKKTHDSDPASKRPIVSAGRVTDSYEFGWHPVLNKSRTRTLSEHKIYETSRKTCKCTGILFWQKFPVR